MTGKTTVLRTQVILSSDLLFQRPHSVPGSVCYPHIGLAAWISRPAKTVSALTIGRAAFQMGLSSSDAGSSYLPGF